MLHEEKIAVSAFSEEEQQRFSQGFRAASGIDTTGCDRPWDAPWKFTHEIPVTGSDIETWSQSWWRRMRPVITGRLAEDAVGVLVSNDFLTWHERIKVASDEKRLSALIHIVNFKKDRYVRSIFPHVRRILREKAREYFLRPVYVVDETRLKIDVYKVREFEKHFAIADFERWFESGDDRNGPWASPSREEAEAYLFDLKKLRENDPYWQW